MRYIIKAAIRILAVIGLFWLLGGPVLRLLLSPTFDRQVTTRVYSPDHGAIAEVEVIKGGLGTVWTTRIHLTPVGQDGWTVYQTKDSEFTPPMRWSNRNTLVIGLPCDRFDYLSNPDDWQRNDARERRFRVRFEYVSGCDTRPE